jgi:hypothetical protein
MLAFVAIGTPACAAEKWGPFRGKVEDRETGQPIAGALVLIFWEKEMSWFHSHREFFDAREAVTRPDGIFEIPRVGGPFFTFSIGEPQFRIFAPGYVLDRWVVTPPSGDPFISPTVAEMRPAKTQDERLNEMYRADSPSIPPEKRCLLTRLINRERKYLGFTSMYPECAP